jgi:hypothetical protein
MLYREVQCVGGAHVMLSGTHHRSRRRRSASRCRSARASSGEHGPRDATKAVISVEDYLYATSQIAQTTLRSVLGQQELDDLLASRDKINAELTTRIIDQHTSPWGVKVATVEVKNVDLPQDMQRAMSKQAEAERERRAKVINAEGEFQAAAKLAEAAEVLSRFSPSRSSSATCRPCVRSPRSGTPRPSSRSRWIYSHPCSAPSAPRSRPRAELAEYRLVSSWRQDPTP